MTVRPVADVIDRQFRSMTLRRLSTDRMAKVGHRDTELGMATAVLSRSDSWRAWLQGQPSKRQPERNVTEREGHLSLSFPVRRSRPLAWPYLLLRLGRTWRYG